MKRHRFFAAVTGTAIVLSASLLMTGTLSAQKPRSTATDLSAVTQNWDKVLPAGERFVILSVFNNEAVRDNETGLVWERTPDEMVRPWGQARSVCAERPVGGRFGWRLPSVHELMTLLDPTTGNPALPAGHPFLNVQPSIYWSATTSGDDPTLAYYVGFFQANLGSPNSKSQTYNYWCVRSGATLSEY
jgi:hypothetical protein